LQEKGDDIRHLFDIIFLFFLLLEKSVDYLLCILRGMCYNKRDENKAIQFNPNTRIYRVIFAGFARRFRPFFSYCHPFRADRGNFYA
jgi:hypothetical protein